MKNNLIVFLLVHLFLSGSILSQKKMATSSFQIDKFVTLNDSIYYKRYKEVYTHAMKMINRKFKANYRYEIFTFKWSGYSGIEDYSFYKFNNNNGEYYKFTIDDSITCDKVDKGFLLDFNKENKTQYLKKLIIDNGYSYGFHQYVIMKEFDNVIFCYVSYRPELIGFKRKSFFTKIINDKYCY